MPERWSSVPRRPGMRVRPDSRNSSPRVPEIDDGDEAPPDVGLVATLRPRPALHPAQVAEISTAPAARSRGRSSSVRAQRVDDAREESTTLPSSGPDSSYASGQGGRCVSHHVVLGSARSGGRLSRRAPSVRRPLLPFPHRVRNPEPARISVSSPSMQLRVGLALVVEAEEVERAVDEQMERVAVEPASRLLRLAQAGLEGERHVAQGQRQGGRGRGQVRHLARPRGAPFLGRPGQHVGGLGLAAEVLVELGDAAVRAGQQADLVKRGLEPQPLERRPRRPSRPGPRGPARPSARPRPAPRRGGLRARRGRVGRTA
jgi:hypothetical protein